MARAKPQQPSAADAAPMLPRRVVLTHPFGFYEADGAGKFWHASQSVTDPEVVRVLIEHGAPLQHQTEA